ncbi:MAG: ABC transporter ATP-binding protein [Oscillospiraceae bacterium]
MTEKDDTLMEIAGVSFAYPDSEKGLKNISVKLGKGERIAVLGNNGAGKSTFFLLCNGILKPYEGKILYEGQEVTGKRSDLVNLRKNVGVVFQDAENQIIASTVEGEVSFGPMNLRLEKQEVCRRVEKSLEEMDLHGYRHRPPQYLSGGEKKRVSIADILAMEPKIILFDEPTASLDPQNVALLEDTLEKLSGEGITLVVSTHDVDFAYRFASRGIVFSGGEILLDTEIDKVFSDTAVLEKSGLCKPLIYEMSQLIREKTGGNSQLPLPKTIKEMEAFLSESIKL